MVCDGNGFQELEEGMAVENARSHKEWAGGFGGDVIHVRDGHIGIQDGGRSYIKLQTKAT